MNVTESSTPVEAARRCSVSAYGPPPTIINRASGTAARIAGQHSIKVSCPLRGTRRDKQRTTGASPSPYRSRSITRAAGSGAKRSTSTPHETYSSAALGPNAAANRLRVYLLT